MIVFMAMMVMILVVVVVLMLLPLNDVIGHVPFVWSLFGSRSQNLRLNNLSAGSLMGR